MKLKALPGRHPSPSCRPCRAVRSGLTLLEVVVSAAIFLFSLTAILQLSSISAADAMESSVRARGALLCQSKLAEVQAGIVSVQGGTGWATFPDADKEGFDWLEGYEWMLTSTPNEDVPGSLVYDVQVMVRKTVSGRGPVEVTLGQMIIDPSKKGSTQDPAVPSAQSAAP